MRLLLLVAVLLCLYHEALAFSYFPTWPEDCQNHPYAEHAQHAKAGEDEHGRENDWPTNCTLTFRTDGKLEKDIDRIEYCTKMYYDTYISHVYHPNGSLSCHYERYHYCNEGDWAYGARCFHFHPYEISKKNITRICDGLSMDLIDQEDALDWIIKFGVFDMTWAYRLRLKNPRRFYVSSARKFVWKPASYRIKTDWITHKRTGIVEPIDDESEDLKILGACTSKAKKHLYGFKRTCTILNDDFKISAAYHKGMCYTQSAGFHVAQKVNVPIINGDDGKENNEGKMHVSVQNLHKTCQFMPDTYNEAVAPTSDVRRDGILKMIEIRPNKNDALLMPGARKGIIPYVDISSKDIRETRDIRERMQYMQRFFYTKPGGNITAAQYAWAEGYPKSRPSHAVPAGIIMHRDGQLRDVPSFVRARISCGIGFRQADIVPATCQAGWKPYIRDDGTTVCHKAFLMPNLTYDEASLKCSEHNATLSPVQSFEEQEIVLAIARALYTGELGSVWLGLQRQEKVRNGTFYWEFDQTPISYTNWKDNEPNDFLSQDEQCVQMLIGPGVDYGKWNDVKCNQKEYGIFGIVAGVCAKHAVPTEKDVKKGVQ